MKPMSNKLGVTLYNRGVHHVIENGYFGMSY